MKTSCPASFWHRKGLSVNFLRLIFGGKEQWIEFETLYSTPRLERLRIFMAENKIPYKVRAALLLVPLNTPMPTGAVTQSPSMALYRPSLGGCVWMPDGSFELSEFQKRWRLKHTASPVDIPTGWNPCQLRLAAFLQIPSRLA